MQLEFGTIPVLKVPEWFTVGKYTPATQKKNAMAGLHPLGLRLKGGDETCGTCAHLHRRRHTRTYLKCALSNMTMGPGSDIRAKWPACEKWEEEKE